MNDDLGDRMKSYEALYSEKLMPYVPAYVRIDGRSFSKFTKGFKKPFDAGLWRIMNDITIELCHQTKAKIGYHQSDEISLILLQDDYRQNMFFDGKVQKLCSVIASIVASKLQHILLTSNEQLYEDKAYRIPHFDCRVCSLPNKTEAANMILWRCLDANRNAIQGLGQANFSHKQLQGMSCSKIVEALKEEKGIDINSCSKHFLYGTFVKKYQFGERTNYESVCIDHPMNRIINREYFVFSDAEPIYDLTSKEGL